MTDDELAKLERELTDPGRPYPEDVISNMDDLLWLVREVRRLREENRKLMAEVVKWSVAARLRDKEPSR